MAPVIQVSQVYYPESDGKPMGETDLHRDLMFRHIELLKNYFSGQDVYVSGDLLVYYEQGNPKKFIVPDAFVVHGIEHRRRRIYKIWVERKSPDVVIETTSRKTRKKDTTFKPQLYARLGVNEYFIFDPEQDYLDPPLQGHRLFEDGYRRIEPDESGALVSEQLGLRLRLEQGIVQFYRLDTGERLLTDHERAREAVREQAEAERREAAARAEAERREAAARAEAEAEIARLRQLLAERGMADN